MGEFLHKSRQSSDKNQNLHQSQQTQLKPSENKTEAKPEEESFNESSFESVMQRKWDSDESGDERNKRRGPVPPMTESEEEPVQRKGPVPLQFFEAETKEEPVQRKGPVPLQFHASEEEEPIQRLGPVPSMVAEDHEEEPIQRKGPVPLQFYTTETEEEPILRRGPIPPISEEHETINEQNHEIASDKLPPTVQAKMENSFGEDFSDVSIYKDSSQSKDLNAHAYTQGSKIHFAPGQYNPESQKGQELIGHELTHVVQQRKGRVQLAVQKKGVGINDDEGLEKEADEMGRRAAEGEVVNTTSSSYKGVHMIQRKKSSEEIVLGKVNEYEKEVKFASEKYGISEAQIKALISVESAGKKNASSGVAFGLMQITKSTWKDTQSHKDYPELRDYDFSSYWDDPKVNIMFGTATFKLKMKTVGVSVDNDNYAQLAITAYNAGEGTIKKAINLAKAAGVKDPTSECLKADYLKPAIESTKIYTYYLTGGGKVANKSQTIEEAVNLKFKEISAYPERVSKYLKLQGSGGNHNAFSNSDENKIVSKVSIGTNSQNNYIVKPGESLLVLAEKFGISVEELKRNNPNYKKPWGEGFNAGEEIKIGGSKKLKMSTTENPMKIMDGFIKDYQSGKISMPAFARLLIPYINSNSLKIISILQDLPFYERDNFAYALVVNSSDSLLTSYNVSLLKELDNSLNTIFTFQNSANLVQANRVKRAIGRDSKVSLQNDKLSTVSKLKSETEELNSLLNKERLQPSEIGRARDLIIKENSLEKRNKFYELLQSKVIYNNQRDSDSSGEKKDGGMCNLTSLSMALSYLGVENPDKNIQYEDALENIRVKNNLAARTTAEGWGGVAKELGVNYSIIKMSFTEKKDWFLKEIRDRHLRNGDAVMVSIGGANGGHIIRIQTITDSGIIVDDPFGKSVLKEGANRSWEGYNIPTNHSERNYNSKQSNNIGEDVLWSWSSVEKHQFRWIAYLNRATK